MASISSIRMAVGQLVESCQNQEVRKLAVLVEQLCMVCEGVESKAEDAAKEARRAKNSK